MAATGAEAAAVAAEEEKRLPEDDPESGGDSEDDGDSDSSGDGEDEEKENEAEIQRLEEQVGPGCAGDAVGRGRWGSAPGPAPGRGKRGWRLRPGLVAFPPRWESRSGTGSGLGAVGTVHSGEPQPLPGKPRAEASPALRGVFNFVTAAVMAKKSMAAPVV